MSTGTAEFAAQRMFGATEMGLRMQRHDWTATSLGEPDSWTCALRTALLLCLGSRLCGCVYWGPEHLVLYNDAYSRLLGKRHPDSLAMPAREVWPEFFDIIGPLLNRTLINGETTGADRLPVYYCAGYPEESYSYFSYTPLINEHGCIEAVFATMGDTSSRIIGERRVATLRTLRPADAGDARTPEEVLTTAAAIIERNPLDIPFAAMYVVDAGGRSARLCATSHISPEQRPKFATLSAVNNGRIWNLAKNARAEPRVLAADTALVRPFADHGIPAPNELIVLPLKSPGAAGLAGIIVAGVSPYKRLDDDYRAFFRMVADQVSAMLAEARTRELETARIHALAELDRTKTAFFNDVSHELRTPLTLMLGPIEELLALPASSPITVARETLAMVHRNGYRLQRLVNTLLHSARLEAGHIRPCFRITDLRAFTAQLVSGFELTVKRAGLHFAFEADCPLRHVPVDPDMWEHIVLNLITNAIKYTLHGSVVVRLKENGEYAELSVQDTGIGIPEQELPRIFERYHRVGEARGRSRDGIGIGLAIVKELVELHNGTVDVSSELNLGSVLTVKVPLERPDSEFRVAATDVEHTTLRPDASVFAEDVARWAPTCDDRHGDEPPRAVPSDGEAESAASVRPRIVVADDNSDMRAHLISLLKVHYDVIETHDGDIALDIVRRCQPHLVLADVMMPRLNGIALVEQLRSQPSTCTIPVILLTARAEEDSRIMGLEHGADDYLVKPFNSRELLARVASAIRLADLRAQVGRYRERMAIARDLHDTVLQSVQGMRMVLEAGQDTLRTSDPAVIALLDTIRTACRRAIAEGRQVLSVLRYSGSERFDPKEALSALVRDVCGGSSMQASVEISGTPRVLRDDITREIYGFCREALSNAVRHSHAQNVTVRLEYGETLRLAVVDDGRGMPAAIAHAELSRHFGLKGMAERAAITGGQMKLSPRTESGTIVELLIPGACAYLYVREQVSV